MGVLQQHTDACICDLLQVGSLKAGLLNIVSFTLVYTPGAQNNLKERAIFL